MHSQTKQTIIQHHDQNRLLHSRTPSIMVHGEQDLSADEVLAPLDERIIASTVEALEAGQTHYVAVPGIDPLRESIAAYLDTATGATYQPVNVLVTAGVQEARFLTIQKIGERYGHIVLPAVVHPGVRKAAGVRALSVETIAVDSTGGMLPTLAAIRQVLEAGSHLLFLESPSRLTGAAYSADEVGAIMALVTDFDAAVIWDQGLSAWVPGEAYVSLAAEADTPARVAAIGEAWPGMGLASWFIGYIAAPEDWIPAVQSQKQIMSICTSTPTQYAALEASKLFAAAHPGQVRQLSQARATLLEQAERANLQPISGAAANVLAVRTALPDAVMATLNRAGYTVADGTDFGAPGVLRFSVTVGGAAAAVLRQLP